MSLKLNDKFIQGFVNESEIDYMQPFADNAYNLLMSGKGPGNDFLGWVDLPLNYDKDEFFQIIKEYRKKSNVIGKKVKISPVINQEQNDFEALVLDITDEAKLKVQTDKNEILFLESGEISTKII